MAFRRVREANQSIGLKRCCDFVVLSRLDVGSCICLIHSDWIKELCREASKHKKESDSILTGSRLHAGYYSVCFCYPQHLLYWPRIYLLKFQRVSSVKGCLL